MQNRFLYLCLGGLIVCLSIWVVYSTFFRSSEVENAAPLEYIIHERNLGDENALVVLEEYSSLTCPTCGYFYQSIMPVIKKRFVETGKVYFKWKHFPHDEMSGTAAALSNLVSGEDFWLLAGDLYRSLKLWYNNISVLQRIVANYVDRAKLDKFMNNNITEVRDKIIRQADSYHNKLGVDRVPTLYINGVKFTDPLNADNIMNALQDAYDAAESLKKETQSQDAEPATEEEI